MTESYIYLPVTVFSDFLSRFINYFERVRVLSSSHDDVVGNPKQGLSPTKVMTTDLL